MLDPTSLPLPATGPATVGSHPSERDVGADGFAALLALLAFSPPAGSAAEPTPPTQPLAAAPPIGTAAGIAANAGFAAAPLVTAPPDPTTAPSPLLPTVVAPASLVDTTEPTPRVGPDGVEPRPSDVPRPNVLSGSVVNPSGAGPEGPAAFGGSTAAPVRAPRPFWGTDLSDSIAPPWDSAVEAAGAPAGRPSAASDRMASDGTDPRRVGTPSPATGRERSDDVAAGCATDDVRAADRLRAPLTPPLPAAESTETAQVQAASVAIEPEIASAPQPAVQGAPPVVGRPSHHGPVDRSVAVGRVADPATGRTGEALDTTGSPDAPPAHAAAFADAPASAEPASGRPGADPAMLPRATGVPTPQPPSVQIASAVLGRDGAWIDRLRVALEPAELGSVELTLTSERRGRTRALVLVERPETLELLQREQRTLERILLVSGLELEAGGLELGLRRDGDRRDGPLASSGTGGPPGEPARVAASPGPARLLELRLLDLVV